MSNSDVWNFNQYIKGRIFETHRKVRMGDVGSDGILRLDSLIRYTQDASNDDTNDAGLKDGLAWVVRSTAVQINTPSRLGENLTISTFAGGIGPSWAQRRIDISGNLGADYSVASLWVSVDRKLMKPVKVSDQFNTIYKESIAGRKVSARKLIKPFDVADSTYEWALRSSDYDINHHVNNAAYWDVIDHLVKSHKLDPKRILIEHRAEISEVNNSLTLAVNNSSDGFKVEWLIKGELKALALVK